MRIVLTLIALSLLVTACKRKGPDVRQHVVGTWYQGQHTLTLSPNGDYISVFPGKPNITYTGKWRMERESLIITDVKSNSAPMAGNTTVKVLMVSQHRFELALGTNRISMTR
jgi:hypothetical protein